MSDSEGVPEEQEQGDGYDKEDAEHDAAILARQLGCPGLYASVKDPWSTRLFLLAGTFAIVVVFLALLVSFQSGTNENKAVEDRRVIQTQLREAQDSLEGTQGQLAEIIRDREREQDEEDCRDLYKDDILFADARSQAQDSRILGLIGRNIGVTDEAERTKNVALIREAITDGEMIGAQVEMSMNAFTDYIASLPFKRCDHPRWPKGQSDQG